MPTAARRAQQRLAKQRAEEAGTASLATGPATSSSAATRHSQKSVATQTTLHAGAVKEIIEQYWRRLDLHHLDQAYEPFQFTVGSTTGWLRASTADPEVVSRATEADEEEDCLDYMYVGNEEIEFYLRELELSAEEEQDKEKNKN